MTTVGTIVFAGDSITEAGRWAEWFPDHETHNLGAGGDTTDHLLARLSEIVDLDPDAVVLLIGTNDLAWRRSVEHVVRTIETILVTLRKALPETRILLQSVIPRGAEYAESIQEINRHLWQFAPTVRAQYLDLWPVLSSDGTAIDSVFSDDELHLTDAGYEAWLAALRPAIDALDALPPITRPIVLPVDHYERPRRGF
ncbi:GDSL-type esterase/lipase family protein [Compostimonas suwonensis]|nr:GDSL-type esterase/lipase family protein [Compostimonas suwonensis]